MEFHVSSVSIRRVTKPSSRNLERRIGKIRPRVSDESSPEGYGRVGALPAAEPTKPTFARLATFEIRPETLAGGYSSFEMHLGRSRFGRETLDGREAASRVVLLHINFTTIEIHRAKCNRPVALLLFFYLPFP